MSLCTQPALQRPTQQRLAEECLSENWIELMPMGIKQLVDSSSSWKTPLGPTHIPLGELEWMSYSGCQEQKGLDEKQTLVSYAQ